MKKSIALLVFSALSVSLLAQLEQYFDFENGYQDTAWNVFDNGIPIDSASKVDIDVIANPLPDAVNSSDSVLSFYIREGTVDWVGMFTDWDVLTEFTEEAHTLGYMIWTEAGAAEGGLKVVRSLTGSDDISLRATITKSGEWELLLFDFTPAIGHIFERLTLFPDRVQEGAENTWRPLTVYIDNLGVPREDNTSVKDHNGIEMMLYPTPATFRMGVVYPGMTGISLHDAMGRHIRTLRFPVTDRKVIETGDLATGIYFLTADTPEGKVTMRFLKE